MKWFRDDKQEILLARLSAEVQYLRDQNTKLTDRLLAIFDSKTYVEIKQIEARDEQMKVQKARVEKMNSDDFRAEAEAEAKHAAKLKVLNMQLSQMSGGSEAAL